MPTIITHNAPHLDEITAIWLLHRFVQRWSRARVQFVASNTFHPPKPRQDFMMIGVGRGQFDEHKGDMIDCAATLVYKFLAREKKIKLTPAQKKAVDELLVYVNDDDHGKLINLPHAEFSIGSALAYLSALGMTSEKILLFGEMYLDGVYAALTEKQILDADWHTTKKISTPWGKGIGIETTVNPKIVLRRAAREGARVIVALNPKNKFRSIRSLLEVPIDLTAAYTVVKKLEPKAEWYLHHSKRMLICGSDVAANVYLSKLPLRALLQLITR